MVEPTTPDVTEPENLIPDPTPTGALAILGRFGSLVRAASQKATPEHRAALEQAFPEGIAVL